MSLIKNLYKIAFTVVAILTRASFVHCHNAIFASLAQLEFVWHKEISLVSLIGNVSKQLYNTPISFER